MVIQPLMKAANSPNDAMLLTQTSNCILFYFCNRDNILEYKKQKAMVGEQPYIVQP